MKGDGARVRNNGADCTTGRRGA